MIGALQTRRKQREEEVCFLAPSDLPITITEVSWILTVGVIWADNLLLSH